MNTIECWHPADFLRQVIRISSKLIKARAGAFIISGPELQGKLLFRVREKGMPWNELRKVAPCPMRFDYCVIGGGIVGLATAMAVL